MSENDVNVSKIHNNCPKYLNIIENINYYVLSNKYCNMLVPGNNIVHTLLIISGSGGCIDMLI